MAAKSSSESSRISAGNLKGELQWVRDGGAEWTVPETWNYTTSMIAGSIYARVAYEDGFWWWWCGQASSAPTFGSREIAQQAAERYVRACPGLMPINY